MLKSKVLFLNDKMSERGIFINPNGEFKSEKEIRRNNEELPILETPKKFPRDFDYWSNRFQKRQETWQETSDVETDHVTIQFKGDTIINFIGDTHVGSPLTHYKRLEQEIKAIVDTPNSYVVLVGDIVDGFFFNPAQMEEMEQAPEQFAYMKALVNHLADKKKLLLGYGGDHDGWIKKLGLDPYEQFNNIGAYYMQGVGHLTAKVGGQEYHLTGAHRLPGFSMYNNVHPQVRASREIQGADIYFSGHTHTKGHAEQAINVFGGSSRKTHFISIGPYKPSDEYARKLGFAQQSPANMYGCAIKLSADEKEVIYYDDILRANK